MTSDQSAGTRYRQAIGRTIATYRSQQGLSLRALSESSGISLAYLSELEHGQKEPSGTILHQLAGSFGISLPELVHTIADQLEAEDTLPDLSLEDLESEEIGELSRFADWLRWRKTRE